MRSPEEMEEAAFTRNAARSMIKHAAPSTVMSHRFEGEVDIDLNIKSDTLL
jgi:hypothetical protein